MRKHEYIEVYSSNIPKNSVIVEIGSDRGEGSTLFLADMAKNNGTVLYSVDIDSSAASRVTCVGNGVTTWTQFYNTFKGADWGDNVSSVAELPEEIQQECFKFGWPRDASLLATHSSIQWVSESGASWSKKFGDINKKIAILYLDNFDYAWDGTHDVDMINAYKGLGVELNNQNCQIEHLTQMINLLPFMDDECVVALDDTYTYNDCWVGKSGPVVIYLLCHDFEIVYSDKAFVILKRKQL